MGDGPSYDSPGLYLVQPDEDEPLTERSVLPGDAFPLERIVPETIADGPVYGSKRIPPLRLPGAPPQDRFFYGGEPPKSDDTLSEPEDDALPEVITEKSSGRRLPSLGQRTPRVHARDAVVVKEIYVDKNSARSLLSLSSSFSRPARIYSRSARGDDDLVPELMTQKSSARSTARSLPSLSSFRRPASVYPKESDDAVVPELMTQKSTSTRSSLPSLSSFQKKPATIYPQELVSPLSDDEETVPELISRKSSTTSLGSFRRTPARVAPSELLAKDEPVRLRLGRAAAELFGGQRKRRRCCKRRRKAKEGDQTSLEAAARWWLWLTTVVHAVGGSVILFAGLLAYVVSMEQNSGFPISTVRNCVIFRLSSLGLVVLTAKSCKGRRLRGRKVLAKLPKVLFAKTLDIGAAFLVWFALLPLLLEQSYRPGVAGLLFLVAVLCLAVDLVGGLVAILAIRRLCGALPEIAAEEVDDEISMSLFDDWAFDDGVDDYSRHVFEHRRGASLV